MACTKITMIPVDAMEFGAEQAVSVTQTATSLFKQASQFEKFSALVVGRLRLAGLRLLGQKSADQASNQYRGWSSGHRYGVDAALAESLLVSLVVTSKRPAPFVLKNALHLVDLASGRCVLACFLASEAAKLWESARWGHPAQVLFLCLLFSLVVVFCC